MDAREVKTWAALTAKTLVPVQVQAADGSWSEGLAHGEIE
jgi:hypothetical protein